MAIIPGRLAGESLQQAAGGSLGVHRFTLIQLAAALARPAMAARGLAPISGLGLEAIAARVAYEALKADELEYFQPVAALPGFARALSKTVGELRMARVTPEDLACHGLAARDLGRLLLRYQDEIRARSLADLAAVLALAADEVKGAENALIGLPVVLVDAPVESRAHRELFQAIAGQSREVLAVIASEDAAAESPVASLENLGLQNLGLQNAGLQHLRKYLFSASPARAGSRKGFEMFSAPGEGLEAVEIGRRILRMADEGILLDEMAILLRSPERYQPNIEDALRRAGVPAWFSRGTARPDPAGRAFLSLLACAAEKCSASRFAEYLSLGQIPGEQIPNAQHRGGGWVGAQNELLGGNNRFVSSAQESSDDKDRSPAPPLPTPAAWEKLLVDAAVIGGRSRWVRRLNGLEREFELKLSQLENDETRRQYVETQLERLRSLREFALPLIERLDSLPKSAAWGEWIGHLTSLAHAALRDPDGVLAVLAELEPMGEVGPVSVEEAAEVLSERLRFLRAEPPQRRWGRVFVGSIDEVRGCEFRVVFLPGLAEGLFPQRALEDPLLLDHVRRELSSDLRLRPDCNVEERERLHLAVGAASERFIASYPRMDVAEARPRVPSFYALELPRALEGALPKLADFEERTRNAAPARLNWPAPPNTDDAIDDAEFDLATIGQKKHARYLVDANLNLGRSLRARWARWNIIKWKEADGLISASAAALEALAKHSLTARSWSPSSLEQFSVCPYKFALHGIYRLRPREDAAPLQQLDPLTRGGLFHEVQRRLLAELKARQLLPLDRERRPEGLAEALELCNRVLDQVAAEYKEKLAPAIERVWNSEIEGLRTDLRGWLQAVAQNDSDWEPLYFEFSFGLQDRAGRDPASSVQEAELNGVRLRGAIDLVERHRDSGLLRVTDHKSGKAPERVPLCVGGGRSLQPVLYGLAAEKILNAKVEYGRLFYATQRGAYRHMAIPVNDRARLVMAQLLRNIDASICSGFLPPVPEKDACSYCDYRLVCGPYEDRRIGRHKQRDDERLDGLVEIRGMG